MRYAIFGGTFDPPHEGHRHVARGAKENLRLDTVLWVPAPDPPLKTKPTTPFPHRLAMVRLAIAGLSGHEASGIEAGLPTPSYTIQTISALKAAHGAGHTWHLLVGADNWDVFQSWHRWEDILKEVTVAVFPREGRTLGNLPAGVLGLPMPELDRASRQVRKDLVERRDVHAPGVLPEIREYILRNGLYGIGPEEKRAAGKA